MLIEEKLSMIIFHHSLSSSPSLLIHVSLKIQAVFLNNLLICQAEHNSALNTIQHIHHLSESYTYYSWSLIFTLNAIRIPVLFLQMINGLHRPNMMSSVGYIIDFFLAHIHQLGCDCASVSTLCS